jgi:hypothetical protein
MNGVRLVVPYLVHLGNRHHTLRATTAEYHQHQEHRAHDNKRKATMQHSSGLYVRSLVG